MMCAYMNLTSGTLYMKRHKNSQVDLIEKRVTGGDYSIVKNR